MNAYDFSKLNTEEKINFMIDNFDIVKGVSLRIGDESSKNLHIYNDEEWILDELRDAIKAKLIEMRDFRP